MRRCSADCEDDFVAAAAEEGEAFVPAARAPGALPTRGGGGRGLRFLRTRNRAASRAVAAAAAAPMVACFGVEGGRERERAGREERNWSMRKRGRGRGRTSVDDDDDDGCKSIELRSRLEKRTYQRQARFVSCCNARRRRPATQRRSRRRSLLLLLQRRRSRWRRRRRRRRRGGTLDGDISFAGFVALMLRLLFLVAARSIVLFARHYLKTLSLSLSDSQGERPSRERGGKRRKRTKEKKCEFEGDGSLC